MAKGYPGAAVGMLLAPVMKLRTILMTSTALSAILAAAACSTSEDGTAALLSFEDEPAGENCAEGGTRVLGGRDTDGDGELDDDEIEDETYICSGPAGGSGDDGSDGDDGADGSDGDPGAVGEPGAQGNPGNPGVTGTKGDQGEPGELGAAADPFLIDVQVEPAGENCDFGGHVVVGGLDTDDDGDIDQVLQTAYLCDAAPTGAAARGFRLVGKYTAPGGPIAEIVSASPDGKTIVYTSSSTGTIGFADITNPSAPTLLGTVNLAAVTGGDGEPTAVAFAPNGQHVVVAVKDTGDVVASADPGYVVVVNAATRTIVGQVAVGVGPDSIALTPDGTKAVVAIEDEENEGGNNAPQARTGSVQIVTLDYANPASSMVATIALTPTFGNMLTDIQPEYVDISPDGATAIVSLQENNLVAVIDIEASEVVEYIDMGNSVHARADLLGDGRWQMTSPFVGQLQPDGVCFLPDGAHFITANEGDTSNGVFPVGSPVHAGGRGFSIFRSTDGARVYESGDAAEWAAFEHGAYPDSRSSNRGIEPEGCGAGTFGGHPFAFVTGERNSTLFVVDVANPAAARIHQVLGAPNRPESVVTIESRGLVLVGGEGDGVAKGGGIWLYEAVDEAADFGHGASVYTSRANEATFSALSALASDSVTGLLLGIPDNAYAEPRIFRFAVDDVSRRVELVDQLLLTDVLGAPLTGIDPEGLVENPEGGFIVATEGTGGNGGGGATCTGNVNSNRLYFFDRQGVLDTSHGTGGIVDLPCGTDPNAFNWANMTSNGFEGVSVVDEDPTAPGGLVVYVGFQRPLTGETRNRIGVYDVDTDNWDFYYYQLDADVGGASGNTFISELIHVGGDKFAVIERDQGWAGSALNKTVRTFTLSSGVLNDPTQPVEKELAVDLLAIPFRFDQEKLEGLAIRNGSLFVVNDNDGGLAHSFFVRLPVSVLGGVEPVTPPEVIPDVVISEVNTNLGPNDWVEVHNRGATPADVSGWKLYDNGGAGIINPFVVPEGTTIPAGGYFLANLISGTHFGLGQNDEVTVATSLGTVVDSYAWGPHQISASRCGTREPFFWLTKGLLVDGSGEPTPGTANDCVGPAVAGQSDIFINEVRTQGMDFVELFNNGASTVDLGNWAVTDSEPHLPGHVYVIPPGTTIPAGGFLLIEGDSSGASSQLTFGLSADDAVRLLSPYEQLVDTYAWSGAHRNTASRCLDPGGTGVFVFVNLTPATKGSANSCL